jgi:hypothetical protein
VLDAALLRKNVSLAAVHLQLPRAGPTVDSNGVAKSM